MTGQKEQPQSQFSARADKAALSLRQSLKQQGRQIPDSRTVEVDANGRPPAPLPPDGSYARQAIEHQRREIAQQRPQLQEPQDLQGDSDIQMQRQDPQATLQSDSVAPEASPTQGEHAQLSDKAQRRISQLAEDLRRKDQELQRLLEESKATKATYSELEEKMQGLQAQHQQLLSNSLADMDPETRTQVLLDGRLAQAIAASEQRMLSQILPKFQALDQQTIDAEMRRLSSIYPGFQLDTHGPLIETFRRSNPRCTVEQAFRAVAEPEELQLASQVRASAVPPVVHPGNGRVQSRYDPPPKSSDPEAELVEEARQLKKLMLSTDPADKTRQRRAVEQHLANRLGHRLPS